MPLRVTIIVISLLIWGLLILGSFGLGLIYVVLIAAFLFLVQVGFIAHIRGTAVKIGEDQFPELHRTIVDYSQRAGLKKAPEAYLMQADGALNAFATKFFRGHFVVLYSDLLEACGDDDAARNMIIGHEIGHIRCRHLEWWTLTAPGRLIPFLGSAYSRACEFTCDRWGAALTDTPDGAKRGLAVLAAGGKFHKQMNMSAYIRQQENLNTGWMTLARWLSTYPPLSSRIAAIAPDPAQNPISFARGRASAWAILLSTVLVPAALIFAVPHLAQRIDLDLRPLMQGIEALFPSDDSFDPGIQPDGDASQTYSSVEDMPAPTPAPQIAGEELAELAQQCFEGDLAACDNLYYNTPYGSPEEAYGLSCGGRLPDNSLDCLDLID